MGTGYEIYLTCKRCDTELMVESEDDVDLLVVECPCCFTEYVLTKAIYGMALKETPEA